MINFFTFSIFIPSLSQLFAIVLSIFNIYLIFIYLDKFNKLNKLFYYIFQFICVLILFSFLWSLMFEDSVKDMHDLWRNIKTIESDPMYDVIAFNVVFIAIMLVKLRFYRR